MLSIFTTYTNPEERMDPWKEAINCYNEFADEVIITGENWKYEFQWKEIGNNFQDGFNKASGDWVIRMDIDYFFHENSKKHLLSALSKSSDYPAIAVPQYQFFTAKRFQLKTRLCVILNKKKFPNIKLNGGGDLCLATLNEKLITPNSVPNYNIPIFQYDSMFRTREVIASDRARFARAWFREFGNFGSRGGSSNEEAYKAWIEEITRKYINHVHKIKFEKHPVFIKDKLKKLDKNQFGYNMFGLEENFNFNFMNYIKGKKELKTGSIKNNISRFNKDYF